MELDSSQLCQSRRGAGERGYSTPEYGKGLWRVSVEARPLQNPTCSPCSVGCREGAGAQDILNVTSYHNPSLCRGRGRVIAISYVQRHCPRKCFLKDPRVLQTEQRLLFLGGGHWFCDSTREVIARKQKCQNFFPF